MLMTGRDNVLPQRSPQGTPETLHSDVDRGSQRGLRRALSHRTRAYHRTSTRRGSGYTTGAPTAIQPAPARAVIGKAFNHIGAAHCGGAGGKWATVRGAGPLVIRRPRVRRRRCPWIALEIADLLASLHVPADELLLLIEADSDGRHLRAAVLVDGAQIGQARGRIRSGLDVRDSHCFLSGWPRFALLALPCQGVVLPGTVCRRQAPRARPVAGGDRGGLVGEEDPVRHIPAAGDGPQLARAIQTAEMRERRCPPSSPGRDER